MLFTLNQKIASEEMHLLPPLLPAMNIAKILYQNTSFANYNGETF